MAIDCRDSCMGTCQGMCVDGCTGVSNSKATGTTNAKTINEISGACTPEACYGPMEEAEDEKEFDIINGVKVPRKKKNSKKNKK